MKHLIQKVLIFIFNFFTKFSKNKNILFSKFMSNHDINYILKNSKIGNCLYVLNVHDIGVSRRIYIGMDDEHLKTIKAIAETGIDCISIGALTHQIKSLDLVLHSVREC